MNGGFFVDVPGLTPEIFDKMMEPCPQCGCCAGTHFSTCPHAPVFIDPNPLPTDRQATWRIPPEYLRNEKRSLYEFHIAEVHAHPVERESIETLILDYLPVVGMSVNIRLKTGKKLGRMFIWAIDYSELKLWVHLPDRKPELSSLRLNRWLGCISI